MPDWYDEEMPEIVRGDEFYLRAFWDLSSERQFGQSIGPIPHSKIIEYAERKRLDTVMIDVFEVVLRELDEVYLKDLNEQQQKQREKTKSSSRSARTRTRR